MLWAERRHPTISAQEAFGLGADDWVHALQRVRLADDEPIAIETTYFPADLTPGLIDQELHGSLWEVLRTQYDVTPGQCVPRRSSPSSSTTRAVPGSGSGRRHQGCC